ncbi:hypothetical protein [Aliisedimentitalea scapharcae]
MKCLLVNQDAFGQTGTVVPGPGRYRDLIKSSCKALEAEDAVPSEDARDILLDAILDEEDADRVILSVPNFFSSKNYLLNEGALYPQAAKRMAQLKQLFSYDQVELFMAIRNPATLLPSVLRKAPPQRIQQALEETDLLSLRWSDTISDIRALSADLPITVWCYEDSPLIWAQIIRDMGGLEHGQKINGGFDLLSTIMSKEGMKRFRGYLHQNPTLTEMQKRRVIAAFLDKFALDDALEEELDLPGWTVELVSAMTDAYDEDIYTIQRIPGVTVIAP